MRGIQTIRSKMDSREANLGCKPTHRYLNRTGTLVVISITSSIQTFGSWELGPILLGCERDVGGISDARTAGEQARSRRR